MDGLPEVGSPCTEGRASEALELDRRHGRRHEEAMALNILARAAFIPVRRPLSNPAYIEIIARD